MIGDPEVRVTCDKCGYKEIHGMTPLAHRSWDMRYLVTELRQAGWSVEGDGVSTLCSECVAEESEEEEE